MLFICLFAWCLVIYFISYLIHAAPVYPSLCLRCINPLITITIFTVIIVVFILLLLLLFYCCHQITVTTDKLLREKSFSGVVELTIQLLSLINILWLRLCRINKLGLYYPRRLLRSPTLVGHQSAILARAACAPCSVILRDRRSTFLAGHSSSSTPIFIPVSPTHKVFIHLTEEALNKKGWNFLWWNSMEYFWECCIVWCVDYGEQQYVLLIWIYKDAIQWWILWWRWHNHRHGSSMFQNPTYHLDKFWRRFKKSKDVFMCLIRGCERVWWLLQT